MSVMRVYQPRAVAVEAVQWRPGVQSPYLVPLASVPEWEDVYDEICPVCVQALRHHALIYPPSGPTVCPGEWVYREIRAGGGTFRTMDDARFRATYLVKED